MKFDHHNNVKDFLKDIILSADKAWIIKHYKQIFNFCNFKKKPKKLSSLK